MISEDEAFWAGIAVATMMLGGGFSMLFLRALTGEGAVVLALGLMTMVLTMQLRAKPGGYIEPWSPYETRQLTPTPSVESPIEPEPLPTESQMEPELNQAPEESAQPAEEPQPEPVQEPAQQPEQTSPQPAQPEPPVEQKQEPTAPEKTEEEPLVIF